MVLNDPLANALSLISNAEKVGKSDCVIKPVSKIILKVLDIMKANNYIGEYKIVKDNSGDYVTLGLVGNINKCNVIKPRFSVRRDEFEKFEKRYLLADGFGIIVVSTPKGMMTLEEAKEKKIGGKLLAYCY